MKTIQFRKPAVVMLSALLLAACGGGSGGRDVAGGGAGGGNPPQANVPDDIGASVPALISYMERLIATDENSDSVDINPVKLAVDDTSESS